MRVRVRRGGEGEREGEGEGEEGRGGEGRGGVRLRMRRGGEGEFTAPWRREHRPLCSYLSSEALPPMQTGPHAGCAKQHAPLNDEGHTVAEVLLRCCWGVAGALPMLPR